MYGANLTSSNYVALTRYVWGKFSLNSSATDYNKYVYDPTGQTLYPPRDRCIDPDPEGKCDHIFK